MSGCRHTSHDQPTAIRSCLVQSLANAKTIIIRQPPMHLCHYYLTLQLTAMNMQQSQVKTFSVYFYTIFRWFQDQLGQLLTQVHLEKIHYNDVCVYPNVHTHIHVIMKKRTANHEFYLSIMNAGTTLRPISQHRELYVLSLVLSSTRHTIESPTSRHQEGKLQGLQKWDFLQPNALPVVQPQHQSAEEIHALYSRVLGKCFNSRQVSE